MLLIFCFSLIICEENLIKNPSFEEVDSDNKIKYWNVVKGSDISSDSHSGKYSLHWKPENKSMVNFQYINIEKNYIYDVCIHFKLNNITALQMYVISLNRTTDYREFYYSHSYKGTNDWKKECYTIGPIRKSSHNNTNVFFLGIYTHAQIDETGTAEAFIDDVSIYRVKDIVEVRLTNDRDEVYDVVNALVRIHPDKGNNSLNNWDFTIEIKDNDTIIYENKEKLLSSSFTFPINITSYNLKDGNIYHVEAIVKSKKDNTEEIFSYPFKKIKNEINNRKVRLDQYGRMFINDELFFPFGIYLMKVEERDLIEVNKTHLNFILPYSQIKKTDMDMIYQTQQGKIKVMYSVKDMYTFNSTTCSDMNEETNYQKFVNKINELKDHPALFSWYINDETPACFHKNLRNRTLTIHELDPNHPTYTVTAHINHTNGLMNTTDFIGMDQYPIGSSEMRTVYDYNIGVNKEILNGKFMLPVIQIFDRAYYYWNRNIEFNSTPPTLQEMKCMSWQGLAAGGKGLLFYSYFDLVRMNHISSFKDRWKDVIEFTNQIWEYKDIILSVEEVDEIKYMNNTNVIFKQWKYNNINYIVVVNLVRNSENFEIDILDNCEINKDFGLGKLKKSGSKIIFELEPIDVIMIKYKISNSKKSNLYTIIICVLIAIVVIILVIGLFIRKYNIRKNKTNEFIDTNSKLISDTE